MQSLEELNLGLCTRSLLHSCRQREQPLLRSFLTICLPKIPSPVCLLSEPRNSLQTCSESSAKYMAKMLSELSSTALAWTTENPKGWVLHLEQKVGGSNTENKAEGTIKSVHTESFGQLG